MVEFSLPCLHCRIYSKKYRGAYLIFCASSAALILRRRLLKNWTPHRNFSFYFNGSFSICMEITRNDLVSTISFLRFSNGQAMEYNHFKLKNIGFSANIFPMLCFFLFDESPRKSATLRPQRLFGDGTYLLFCPN